jgi:hypothetical protein
VRQAFYNFFYSASRMETKFVAPPAPKPVFAWKPKRVGVIQPAVFVAPLPIVPEEFVPRVEATRWYPGGE